MKCLVCGNLCLNPWKLIRLRNLDHGILESRYILNSKSFSKIEDVYTAENTLILITTKFRFPHCEPCCVLPCLISECNFQTQGQCPPMLFLIQIVI